MDEKCTLHGKVKYLYIKLAKAKLCQKCIEEGLYIDSIVEEYKRVYPQLAEVK